MPNATVLSVIFALFVVISLLPDCTMASNRKVGGIGDEKEPDSTVHEIVQTIRPALETKLGASLGEVYKPVSYKTQLVNGVNYFIKIDVGNDKFIHVRVYRTFAGETSLAAVKRDKGRLDAIEYFDAE